MGRKGKETKDKKVILIVCVWISRKEIECSIGSSVENVEYIEYGSTYMCNIKDMVEILQKEQFRFYFESLVLPADSLWAIIYSNEILYMRMALSDIK